MKPLSQGTLQIGRMIDHTAKVSHEMTSEKTTPFSKHSIPCWNLGQVQCLSQMLSHWDQPTPPLKEIMKGVKVTWEKFKMANHVFVRNPPSRLSCNVNDEMLLHVVL